MCNSKNKRNYITIDLYCLKTHLVSLNPSQIASTAANFIIVLGQFVSQIHKTTKGTVWFVPKTFRKINTNYTRAHRIRRKSTASRIYVSARGAPRAKVSYWNQQTAPHTYREVVEFVMFFLFVLLLCTYGCFCVHYRCKLCAGITSGNARATGRRLTISGFRAMGDFNGNPWGVWWGSWIMWVTFMKYLNVLLRSISSNQQYFRENSII